MAVNLNKFCQNESFSGLSADICHNITKIQAAWRGILVRRKLKQIKKIYEDVFYQIEGDEPNLTVKFPKEFLCKPQVTKLKADRNTYRAKDSSLPRSSTPIHSERYDLDIDSSRSTTHSTPRISIASSLEKLEDVVTHRSDETYSVSSENGDRDRLQDKLDNVDAEDQALEDELDKSPIEAPTRDEPSQSQDDKLTDVKDSNISVDVTPVKDPGLSLNFTADGSVWEDTFHTEDEEIKQKCNNVEALTSLRENITMELLWIQQAIDSRKNYLRLKTKMDV